MTTQTEALKLALEALDQLTNAADTFSVSGVYFNEGVWAKKCLSDAYFAITTIEQALAQPEQEPVAWMEGESVYWHTNPSLNDWIRANGTPLYTTPPQRKPLTDEELEEIVKRGTENKPFHHWFARAIEAAHGIKEQQ